MLRRFWIQFFVSPFQFFIVIPWGLAFFAIATGTTPLKSGGKIERANAPAEFWRSVWFAVLKGGVCFVMNLVVSWIVISRGN